MAPREIVVVGETPSLGRSIVDLLRAYGLPCRLVLDLRATDLAPSADPGGSVVFVACNQAYCATARRWARGELPNARLVVVGARDPELAAIPAIRVVPLPLRLQPLVTLARELLGVPASPGSGSAK
jgi:hypothetical protein